MAVQFIALDAMGGDLGPEVTIPAALDVIAEHPLVHIILVGDKQKISQKLQQLGASEDKQLSIQHASQVIAMDEAPAQALRSKKDASMRIAMNLIKEGKAKACVSAGNTGALMAIGRFVLRTIEGIDRPAIISMMPTLKNHCYMLDLGANVDCSVEQLFQFAVMGSVLVRTLNGITAPKVALLNVGEEDIKGNEQVKATAKKLAESPAINYIGYVEGDAIFKGVADVVVCDGFMGNVSLKTMEGVAQFINLRLREAFSVNLWSKLCAMLARPVLKKFSKSVDPRNYNGATFIGLKGIVIKSHGGADRFALVTALKEAVREIEKDVPTQIQQHIAALLQSKVEA